jgi:hypothetical protein
MVDFEWLVAGGTRPIPTSASIPNRLSGNGFVTEGSATDTKSDTSFPTPKESSETPGNSPATL